MVCVWDLNACQVNAELPKHSPLLKSKGGNRQRRHVLSPLEIIAQSLVKVNSLLLHTSSENICREFKKGHHGKEYRSRQSLGPALALACQGENVTQLSTLGVQNAIE